MSIKKRLKRIERYITRDRIKFTRTVGVSGVVGVLNEGTQDGELQYLVEEAKEDLIQELESKGYLRVTPLPRTGDDKKVIVTLRI